MEPKSVLGTSLLVPSVKELVKEQLTKIPQRYLLGDHRPASVLDTSSLPQVPVIDFTNLFSNDLVDLEMEKFDCACKHWGFFQLINHGVSTELLEKVKLETEKFFDLPKEQKQQFWQKTGELEGFGQHFVSSEDQKLEWADLFYLVTQPAHMRNPYLFSNLPPSFREAIEAYSEEVQGLAKKIIRIVAKATGMEAEDMNELFEQGWQGMRMNYYPPCPQPDLVIGLKPHSDATGLTILFQLNDIIGLQIKKDEMWIPVYPIPNAFIINIGDFLEIVTNGRYRSIEHRATVNSIKERISIATFYNPKVDGELGPAPSLINDENQPVFGRTTVSEYLKGYLSHELNGKSFLQVWKIENDQP